MVAAQPTSARPTMFDREPSGPPVPWSWADRRLRTARAYWVVSVSASGRPHVRPYWGCWTGATFLFSTRSRALRNVRANDLASVHLESGTDVVVVEGRASVVDDPETIRSFVEDYNRKYEWTLESRGTLVGDDRGASGNVVAVQAGVVYAWQQSVETATRWTFVTPR